jgi:hypothetical protein
MALLSPVLGNFLLNKIVSSYGVQDEFPCYIKRCIERIRENFFYCLSSSVAQLVDVQKRKIAQL